jgi:hypothetical protein
VLKIHGRAQTVDLGADEASVENPLEQAEVVLAGCVACSRGAAVVGGDELEGLWLGNAHAARENAQAMRTELQIDDGTDDVALFAPHLEQAAAMLLAHRETREAHVE